MAHAPCSFFPILNLGESTILFCFILPLYRRVRPRRSGAGRRLKSREKPVYRLLPYLFRAKCAICGANGTIAMRSAHFSGFKRDVHLAVVPTSTAAPITTEKRLALSVTPPRLSHRGRPGACWSRLRMRLFADRFISRRRSQLPSGRLTGRKAAQAPPQLCCVSGASHAACVLRLVAR